MKNSAGLLTIVTVFMALHLSCTKEKVYPVIPKINYVSHERVGTGQADSIRITIDYLDGDGDLGLNQGDTFPPFDGNSPYFYNLFVEYYEKINGKFTKVPPDVFSTDTIEGFFFRFPGITPETRTKAIKGEIIATVAAVNVFSDTVKYRIYIVDRALHHSNTVETPEIVF